MSETDPSSKTILIVDDDESICAFFEVMLMREGFRVIVCLGGSSALDQLKGKAYRKIDLVLLDLMMPAPGGYEVLKELQQPDYQNVPIFVVTAREFDQANIAMLRLESNVKEFFKKPIDQKEFTKKIHQHLETVPQSKPSQTDPYGNP